MKIVWRLCIGLLLLDVFFRLAGPQILEQCCTPWNLSDGQVLRFQCKNLSLGNIELENIALEGPLAHSNIKNLRVDFNILELLQKQKLNSIIVLGASANLQKSSMMVPELNPSGNTDDAHFSPPTFQTTWQKPLELLAESLGDFLKEIPLEIEQFECQDIQVIVDDQRVTIPKVTGQFNQVGGLELNTQLCYNQVNLDITLKALPESVNFQLLSISPSLAGDHLTTSIKAQLLLPKKQLKMDLEVSAGQQFILAQLSGNTLACEAECQYRANPAMEFQSLVHVQWNSSTPISGYLNLGLSNQHFTLLPTNEGWNIQTDGQQNHSDWAWTSKNFSGNISTAPFSVGPYLLKKGVVALKLQPSSKYFLAQFEKFGDGDFLMENTHLELPLSRPAQGHFNTLVKVSGKTLTCSLNIQRSPLGWTATGNIQCPDLALPMVNLFLTTGLDGYKLPKFEFNAHVPQQKLSLRPDELSPSAPDGSLQIQCSANVSCSWSLDGGWQEHLRVDWNDGFFSSDDFSMMVKGLYGHIESDRLSSFATGPAQVLGWQSLKGHGFNLQEGKLLWQWEKEQRFFLESLRTQWCHGHITIQPIRLKMPVQELDLSLFCENLQLADLLREFQVGDVEGQGELGGHISASLSPKGMTFKDAYLYTSPASDGRLKINESQILDMMVNRDDQPHLRLVREALRDYVYQWAKVQFDAEGQDLIFRLSLDGQPKNLLPFRFDDKAGMFAYDVEGKGAHLQGLKINTNLKSLNLWPVIQALFQWSQKVEF